MMKVFNRNVDFGRADAMTLNNKTALLAATFALIAGLAGSAAAAEDHSLSSDEAIEAVNKEFKLDVNTLFATRCAACHLGKGLQRGDGPALAETSFSYEKVIERIKKGKTPMPAFDGAIKEEEIKALARYIKLLKPNT
jgi:mono/diheme cytochrome c family protein